MKLTNCASLPLAALLALASGPATGAVSTPAAPSSEPVYRLVPIPESAVHHGSQHAPRIRNSNGTSTNWSGYAIATGTTTDVKGSWKVPTTVPSTSTTTYSSTWVGIDGYDTNTVEQVGTEDDYTSSGQRHYAWFEMYPRSAYMILNFTVNPGDTINAEVQRTGKGVYKLTIVNGSQTFTTTQKLGSARNGSAEWIVEAPWSGGVLPLADFQTVTFSSCMATINGYTGTLGDTALGTPDPITMQSGTTVKAQPGSLTSSGGFTVTWYHE